MTARLFSVLRASWLLASECCRSSNIAFGLCVKTPRIAASSALASWLYPTGAARGVVWPWTCAARTLLSTRQEGQREQRLDRRSTAEKPLQDRGYVRIASYDGLATTNRVRASL